MGLDGLSKTQAERVRVGNALAEVAATLMKVQHAAGNHYELEQPAKTTMLEMPVMKKAIIETAARTYQRYACSGGAPGQKSLLLITPNVAAGKRLIALCPGPAWAAAVAKTWTISI